MSRISRRGLLAAGIAACAVPVFRAAPLVLTGPGPIELSQGVTHIQLVRAARAGERHCDRFDLVLQELAAASCVGYGVYLNAGATPQGARRAGAIRFRQAAHTRSFDVTALLRGLGRAGWGGDRAVVSLVPHGTSDPHATPRIGGLYLIAV